MLAYILIIITTGGGGNTAHWSMVTMQRFADARACQFASLQIAKLADYPVNAVCVPEASK